MICTSCGSHSVVKCPGGTGLKFADSIVWICSDCLNEW